MPQIVLYTNRKEGVMEGEGGLFIQTSKMKELRRFPDVDAVIDYIDLHAEELDDVFFFSGSATLLTSIDAYLKHKVKEAKECQTVAQ